MVYGYGTLENAHHTITIQPIVTSINIIQLTSFDANKMNASHKRLCRTGRAIRFTVRGELKHLNHNFIGSLSKMIAVLFSCNRGLPIELLLGMSTTFHQ